MSPLSPEAEAISRKLAALLGQTLPESKPGVVTVQSRTTAGVFYEVVIGLDGVLQCNCPASFYPARGECVHVKLVREDMMTNGTSTALVPVVIQQPTSLLPTSHDLDVVNRAAAMAYAGAVSLPPELNSPEKVAAVMLYGLELGLRPMTAIQGLYIVKGKVSASAQIMMGLCMSREPNIAFHVKRTDHEACTIRMVRPSRGVDAELTITWEQIKRAGLAGGVNAVYPEDRLRYHCIKRLCRTYAPDLINGLDEGVSVTGVTAPAPWPVEDDLYNEGDAPANVDRETGEIIEHEATQQAPAPAGTPASPGSVAPPAAPSVDMKVQAQKDWEQTDAYKEAEIEAEYARRQAQLKHEVAAAPESVASGSVHAAPPPSVDSDAAADRKEIVRLIKELQGVWSVEEVKQLGVELKQYLPDPSGRFVVSALDADNAAAALGHVRSAIAQRDAAFTALEAEQGEMVALDESAQEEPDEAEVALHDEDDPHVEPPHAAVMKYTPGGRAFCETCGEAVDEATGEHMDAVPVVPPLI